MPILVKKLCESKVIKKENIQAANTRQGGRKKRTIYFPRWSRWIGCYSSRCVLYSDCNPQKWKPVLRKDYAQTKS